MTKRKGPSILVPYSGPRTRSKATEGIGEANNSVERDVGEDECGKLRCEVRALEGKRAELSEIRSQLEDRKRKLEEQKRKLEERELKLGEQLPPLRCELEQVQRNWLPKSIRLKDLCNEREVENAQRLVKLPQEVWRRILAEIENDDLFPLALSCRYFRQRQKELVTQWGQMQNVRRESGESRRALNTDLKRKLQNGHPASAEYLQFAMHEMMARKSDGREVEPGEVKPRGRDTRSDSIYGLAAYHGHLPLLKDQLQEHLQKGIIPMSLHICVMRSAGQSVFFSIVSSTSFGFGI